MSTTPAWSAFFRLDDELRLIQCLSRLRDGDEIKRGEDLASSILRLADHLAIHGEVSDRAEARLIHLAHELDASAFLELCGNVITWCAWHDQAVDAYGPAKFQAAAAS